MWFRRLWWRSLVCLQLWTGVSQTTTFLTYCTHFPTVFCRRQDITGGDICVNAYLPGARNCGPCGNCCSDSANSDDGLCNKLFRSWFLLRESWKIVTKKFSVVNPCRFNNLAGNPMPTAKKPLTRRILPEDAQVVLLHVYARLHANVRGKI